MYKFVHVDTFVKVSWRHKQKIVPHARPRHVSLLVGPEGLGVFVAGGRSKKDQENVFVKIGIDSQTDWPAPVLGANCYESISHIFSLS